MGYFATLVILFLFFSPLLLFAAPVILYAMPIVVLGIVFGKAIRAWREHHAYLLGVGIK
jgi:hypothetical protein|tara:strand:- start:702 stop:878 length:177 start_codon:yes stop_codon:yes gene_type:complete